MGTIYKKTFTKSLPANAEVFLHKGKRSARWKDARGKTKTALLTAGRDGADRILVTVGTYTAKYRDGRGVVREKATGCRDKEAAGRVLSDLERRAELVKANVMTAAEDAVADHQETPLAEHFDAYLTKLEADETSPNHRANVRRCLNRIADACGFARLADLKRESLEKYLTEKAKAGVSARTRNLDRASLVAFCNWCIETERLMGNPFAGIKKADENADPRRKRRALTEEELIRLLAVASRRPLLDRMTVRRGRNKGKAVAELRPATRIRLEELGRERALIYKTLVLTGLRKKELDSLTAGQLELDGRVAFAVLHAADEKNRQGSEIPLRADLAADLREWLTDKLRVLQAEARQQGKPIPLHLPPCTSIFTVPDKLVRILDRDLKAAGIPKRDERGRTVDVHALRHSFGTLLSKGGVAPRTAQAAMRHSSLDLTMNVYTDPKLLDVHGALDVLPELPLDGGGEARERATGTAGPEGALAPMLAPKTGKHSISRSIRGIGQDDPLDQVTAAAFDVSAYPVNRKTPLTTSVSGVLKVGDTGLEPVTPSLSS